MKIKNLLNESTDSKAVILTFILLIQILFTGAGSLNAQIVINESFRFTPGDQYISESADTANVTEGNSGANVTWNFSAINLLGNELQTEFVNPNGLPGSSFFPGATLAQQFDGTYVFAKDEGNAVYSMGMYSEELGVRSYTDMQKVFQYPFSFGNSFSDNYSSVMEGNEFNVHSNGTSVLTADAWGTLILPSGSFTNSLRVKSVTDNIDTIYFEGSSIVSVSQITNYSWYVSGSKAPVLNITYIRTPFSNLKTVSYVHATPTSISDPQNEIAEKFTLGQNFPNPFNPSTKINFSIAKSGQVSLKVYDMTGKEVAVLANEFYNAGNYTADFDAASLTSGTYFYKLESNGISETKRMMLVK